MKKTLLALTTALLTALSVNAQITLNSSSYTTTFAGTVDTFLSSGSGTTYPSSAPATNATWDFSTAVLTTPVSYGYNVNPDVAAYSSATFADSELFGLSTYTYIGNQERAFTSTGYLGYGDHVNRQAIHLTGGVFVASDSLIFNAQDLKFSTPWTYISFPATYNSHWSSSFTDSFTFALDVAALTYHNTPGTIKESFTETDTVIGWGQLRVKEISGSPSLYMHVLQVRKKSVTIDSFFINGAIPTSTVLGAFGVTEGQRSASYYINYYRPNEAKPLATVNFTDSTYSTPSSASTLAENYLTDLTTSIGNVSADNIISIYPNPVTNKSVTLSVPGAQDGRWSYELSDINGAKVQTGSLSLSSSNSTTQLTLSETLIPGIYYISLKNNGELVAIRGLDIVK